DRVLGGARRTACAAARSHAAYGDSAHGGAERGRGAPLVAHAAPLVGRNRLVRAVAGAVPHRGMARRDSSGVCLVGAGNAGVVDLEASHGAAHFLGAHTGAAHRRWCDSVGARRGDQLAHKKIEPRRQAGLEKLERRGFLKPRRMYEVLTLPFAFPALGPDVKQSLSNPPERLVGSKMWSLR